MHAARRSGIARRPALALVAVAVAVLAAVPASALSRTAPASKPTDWEVGRPGGEPEIAVNPRNPRNLVVGENVTGVAYTRDGGATWHSVRVPNIGDNVLAVQRDGTFLFSSIDGNVWASHDGGETWVKNGNWVGAAANALYGALPDIGYPGNVAGGDIIRQVSCDAPDIAELGPVGTQPDSPGATVLGCDRPWLVADPQTGRLYLSFAVHTDPSGGDANPQDPGTVGCHASSGNSPYRCGRQYVAASADDGRTWTPFKPMDSATYPAAGTNGWSGGPQAAFGRLATAYVGNAPNCPALCVVFETSANDGTTWQRHVIAPVALPTAANGLSTTFNFEPYIAADPSHPGRFAVMVLDSWQRHLVVYVTSNNGSTWSRTLLAEPGKGTARWTPWIAYGPTGVLGAMWRTSYADGSFDVWAALSTCGTTRFTAPVRLSSSRSPGPVAPGGDDASGVLVTRDTLYATWGDQRGQAASRLWFGSASNHVGSYRFGTARC